MRKSAVATSEPIVLSTATGRLSDRVYDHILGQIVIGVFPLDCRLPPETKLADRLGVSRPVVREALMRLREDGLVASRQGAGSFVVRRPAVNVYEFAPMTSIADVQRCFIFRMALEGEAAAQAARNHDDESLRRIEEALAQLDDIVATHPQGRLGVEEDIAFHRAVAEATGNRFFAETLTALRAQIAIGINLNRKLSLIQPRNRVVMAQQEHRDVFEAIAAHDEDKARAAMRAHIENARKRVFEAA